MSSRAEALRKLKQGRSAGASGLAAYEVEEDREEHIYDEVTEEEYNAIRRRKMDEGGDFVVDDDGLGYVDYGQDEWASDNSHSSEEEEEEASTKASKAKRKRGKENKQQKPGAAGNIQNLLNRQAQNPRPKAKPTPISAATEQDLLGSIFEDLDDHVNEHKAKKAKSEYEPPVSVSSRYTPFATSDWSGGSTYTRPQPQKVAEPIIKTEPAQQPDIETAAEHDANDAGVQANTSFDDISFEEIDEQTLAEITDATNQGEETTDISNIVQVKVKPLQTRSAKQVSSVSFAPKFQRVEEAQTTIAESTVVNAPETAGCRGWMAIKDTVKVHNIEHSQATQDFTQSKTAGSLNVMEEDGSLRMFWFDATEMNGVVYLFGKVQNKNDGNYVSCCAIVQNIQRNVFILPRAKVLDAGGHPTDIDVEMSDVYKEFDTLRRKHGIREYASATVSRSYAFEIPGIPAESDYQKVVYPYSQPELPAKLSGRTFSRVFGTNTSALEQFILKRKLMGPCWVEIKNANLTNKSVSWCKVEVTIDDPKLLNPFKEDDESAPKKSPPLVVLSLSMRTVTNHQKHVNEIVAASGLVYNNVNIDGGSNDQQQPSRFTVIRQLNDVPIPAGLQDLCRRHNTKVEIHRNEHGLLGFLIAQIHRSDPDIIVGHNFIDFDLDVLLHRMKANNILHWSKLGRLNRKKWPKLQAGAGGTQDSTYAEKQIASGRLLCDTYRAAQDLIRSKSYSLTQLAASQLNVDRPSIEYEKVHTYFWDAAKLIEMIQHCEVDGILQAQLMFKLQVLPLTKQLTNLAGNLWARTMTGARAERNEYLLLHEFHNRKFVVPDKASFGSNNKVIVHQGQEENDEQPQQVKKGPNGRRKPAYAGGLVLEPKTGFYDKFVLLLDFNSLYPSIIQEYNICFTTVERNNNNPAAAASTEDDLPEIPDADLPKGILPKLLGTLVDRRRVVKNLMKDPRATPAELAQYDIRQKGLKLTANSMYGCLGFSHSRFYAKPLAMLITAKGREILQNTVHVAEEERLEVIYGDTDSIMINTNSTDLGQVKKMGNEFKKAVNKRYKLLEIEMDGFFQRMLLLKKKKYAAITVEEKNGQLVTALETKGLDLVRRDWCGLSQDVCGHILNQIFSGAPKEDVLDMIHAHLTTVGQEVRAGLVPIEKFVVNKGLTKNPEDYADKKSQPHVQVALQMKTRGIVAKAGDTIPYVICCAAADATGGSIAERARHPDDVGKPDSGLKVDFEWYLSNQVHPPVARLCGPIEGTDLARLADCLGLDPAKFHATPAGNDAAETGADALYTLDSQLTDAERFKDVDPWHPRCYQCGESHPFEGVVRLTKDTTAEPVSSLSCPTCLQTLPTPSLVAQLSTAIRQHIKRYANTYLVCDDPSCPAGGVGKTRHMGVYAEKCLVPNCMGTVRLEYDDRKLYTQLMYYERLFEVGEFEKRFSGQRDLLGQFNTIILQDSPALKKLQSLVAQYMEKNARRYVDLKVVFSFIAPLPQPPPPVANYHHTSSSISSTTTNNTTTTKPPQPSAAVPPMSPTQFDDEPGSARKRKREGRVVQ